MYLLDYNLKSVAARSGGLLIKAFPPDRAAYTNLIMDFSGDCLPKLSFASTVTYIY